MILKARLTKLEAVASPEDHGKWFRVTGRSEEECEAQRRALIDAGQALETDNFVFRVIVTPKGTACAT